MQAGKTSTWAGAAGVAGLAAALVSEITGAGNLEPSWHHYAALVALAVVPHLAEQLAAAFAARGFTASAADVRELATSLAAGRMPTRAELERDIEDAITDGVKNRDQIERAYFALYAKAQDLGYPTEPEHPQPGRAPEPSYPADSPAAGA